VCTYLTCFENAQGSKWRARGENHRSAYFGTLICPTEKLHKGKSKWEGGAWVYLS
jgi:hypothetical protein